MPTPVLADASIFFCENFLHEVEIFLLIVRVNVGKRRIIFKFYFFVPRKFKEQIIDVAIGQVVFVKEIFRRDIVGAFKLPDQISAFFYFDMESFFIATFFGQVDMSEGYQKFVVNEPEIKKVQRKLLLDPSVISLETDFDDDDAAVVRGCFNLIIFADNFVSRSRVIDELVIVIADFFKQLKISSSPMPTKMIFSLLKNFKEPSTSFRI